MYKHLLVHAFRNTYMRDSMNTWMHACIHTYMHTHIHQYTHTHTHARVYNVCVYTRTCMRNSHNTDIQIAILVMQICWRYWKYVERLIPTIVRWKKRNLRASKMYMRRTSQLKFRGRGRISWTTMLKQRSISLMSLTVSVTTFFFLLF